LKQVVAECERQWFDQTLKAAKAGETAMQTLVGQMLCSGYGSSVNVKEVQCSSSQPLHSSFSFFCVCVCVFWVGQKCMWYIVLCVPMFVCNPWRGEDWFGKHQGILWLQKAAEKDQEAQNLLASLSCTHPNLVIFYAFHVHLHACVLFAYLSIFTLLCWGQIQFVVGFCKDGRLLHKKKGGGCHLVWGDIKIVLLHPCVAAMPSPYWVMNTAMCCGAWWCSWLKVQHGFLCRGIGCCFICHVHILHTSGELREVVPRVHISSSNWFHMCDSHLPCFLNIQHDYIFFIFIYGDC
jgi:hypothetical protein